MSHRYSRPSTTTTRFPLTNAEYSPTSSAAASARQRTGLARPRSGRPRTAQPRPNTGRPTTAASTRYESTYVLAVLEGRGVAREVGLAALDRETGKVHLVQVADCQTYMKTLHQMQLYYPSLILVPDTFLATSDLAGNTARQASLLVQYIQEEFPSIAIEPVARRYWNDNTGMELIKQYCVESEERTATILAASTKYYALSATSALLTYAETRLNTRFAAHTLRINCVPVEGSMVVDVDTARNLELISSATKHRSTASLFGVVNYTHTAMAARQLRANILSPITSQASLEARLDAVEELVQSEDKYNAVRDGLKALNNMDFDKLIASLATSEVRITNNAKPAAARVAQVLNLRNLVRGLPVLQKALAGCGSQILQAAEMLISDERIAVIEQLVCSRLNEDSAPSKGGIAAVNARVYAVKANCDRLLDVARETYKENVSDILQLGRKLGDEHDLPIVLQYQDNGGFVFTLKRSNEEERFQLPQGFINATCKKGKWSFSSLELKKMNARMKDALDETLILSEKIIHELVEEILTDISVLYKASEAVAILDIIWSFANIAITRSYVRPEFTETLAIKAGRHPILETIQSAGNLVPNDAYCDDSSSFQIIQGPNMSGKSTYLRQIGLLTVMAHCGSFVPAEYASFRIHDALLTRLSNDDDLEKNLSTFASEMASTAMILGMATPRTLVLVDELGRGTSPKEGVGISHAIAEALIELKPFVFFATHFSELTTTLSRKPSVVNMHLSVQKTKQSASNFGMNFRYKILDGVPSDMKHYGLELARLADLPNDVLEEATRVANKLSDMDAQQHKKSESSRLAERRKAVLALRSKLIQALDYSELPDEDLLVYLGRFQKDVLKTFLVSEG